MIAKLYRTMRSFLLGLLACSALHADEFHIQIGSKDHALAQTHVALIVTTKNDLLSEIAHVIQTDMQQSGQTVVTVHQASLPNSKYDLERYYANGDQFVIFLTMTHDRSQIIGRLYDALDATMLQGKKWQKRGSPKLWAHTIAHDLWKELFSNSGSFLSKIAYIKKSKNKYGKQATQLCVKDWDTRQDTVVLQSNSILVAPTWKHDGDLLFCSQFTNRNVRLIATNLEGSSWVVLSRDGTTSGVSSAAGCDDVVYCHSGEIWKFHYDAQRKKSRHTLITREGNMCACPTLLTNGDVIYCAGGKIKQWCAQEGKSKALTEQGYCTGPAYHEETQQVVFSQKVGKRMQLFVLHVRSGKSQQLTFDEGDKIDPSWSPCGTYIVYCLKKDKTSEIVVFNTVTKRHERITAGGDYCSCPSWSPVLRS